MGKRTELGMPTRPLKARPWDKDGKSYQIWIANSSIENKVVYSFIERKALGLGCGKLPNWECLFVHRKQGFWTRMGKRTEVDMLIRPSEARPWD